MNLTILATLLLALAIAAIPIAAVLARSSARRLLAASRSQSTQILEEAKREAESARSRALLEGRETIAAERSRMDQEAARRSEALRTEELRIERAAHDLEQKEADAAGREAALTARERLAEEDSAAAAAALAAAAASLAEQERRLEQIAGLTREEAREELSRKLEEDVRRQMASFIKRATEQAHEEADRTARTLVAQAIHRSSGRAVVQATMTPIRLPSDEIKGRIIGREGRNIRAIESATGVDVIIDDTPNTLLLSSYDPLRREIARIAIERLIEDGRVHPARIEEVTAKVREETEDLVGQAGEAAALGFGLAEIHPRLLRLLGRLKFRTQHGYSLLDHAVEVASLAGYMAAELGAKTEVTHRAGLLHDVAQAEDDPPASPAPLASSELALKYGESEEVSHAIRAIHRSVEPRTMEALLVAAAERIALNRPGARSPNLATFIDRLNRLEQIANSFKGVRKSYAVRAGKELRVMVEAEEVSDEGVASLSREIAARIEQDADYPGQIRVQVIREVRSIDFAV